MSKKTSDCGEYQPSTGSDKLAPQNWKVFLKNSKNLKCDQILEIKWSINGLIVQLSTIIFSKNRNGPPFIQPFGMFPSETFLLLFGRLPHIIHNFGMVVILRLFQPFGRVTIKRFFHLFGRVATKRFSFGIFSLKASSCSLAGSQLKEPSQTFWGEAFQKITWDIGHIKQISLQNLSSHDECQK